VTLARLLRPRSIAVIGGKPAREVIRQNAALGFAGRILPIHPTAETIEGHAVHRALGTLPEPPDAVFLAVNRHLTVRLVRELSEMGAGGTVAYASGFAEAGSHGAALQHALREAAGAMPVLGPNCYGTINYLDGAALWPDQHGGRRIPRGVALVTQSGNIGLNLTMQRRGLPVAMLATLGNQAVVGAAAVIAALAQDHRITAIGLHLEGIDDPDAFAAAASAAHARGIPIAAVVVGASPEGATLALSHTASMAASDAVADAFLRRIGVARLPTLTALIEALKLLHVHGRLASPDIVSLSCSGGEAALFADRAAGHAIRFRPFTPAQRDAVAATVPDLVTVSNPFDYHTFHWANRAALTATFAAVMRCDFALTLLVLDFPRSDRGEDADWRIAADALADAAAATGRAAAILATLPENMPEALAEHLIGQGIVPLCGMDDALHACAAALASPGTPILRTPLRPGTPILLDERQSKALLAAAGVPIPAEAGALYPVVAKALGIAHKTERRAVRLNLTGAASVAAARAELAPLGHGVLVEEMVEPGVELIVGVARDPVLGPYLLLGSGGILAELVGDRAILMLPATSEAIAHALSGLKASALIAGHRGREPGNRSAAIAAILAIQAAAIADLDRLIELDVNPLIVTPTRAVAADALIRLVEPA
jgi:acyl-CoA synthetase (NDP forming)